MRAVRCWPGVYQADSMTLIAAIACAILKVEISLDTPFPFAASPPYSLSGMGMHSQYS